MPEPFVSLSWQCAHGKSEYNILVLPLHNASMYKMYELLGHHVQCFAIWPFVCLETIVNDLMGWLSGQKQNKSKKRIAAHSSSTACGRVCPLRLSMRMCRAWTPVASAWAAANNHTSSTETHCSYRKQKWTLWTEYYSLWDKIAHCNKSQVSHNAQTKRGRKVRCENLTCDVCIE